MKQIWWLSILIRLSSGTGLFLFEGVGVVGDCYSSCRKGNSPSENATEDQTPKEAIIFSSYVVLPKEDMDLWTSVWSSITRPKIPFLSGFHYPLPPTPNCLFLPSLRLTLENAHCTLDWEGSRAPPGGLFFRPISQLSTDAFHLQAKCCQASTNRLASMASRIPLSHAFRPAFLRNDANQDTHLGLLNFYFHQCFSSRHCRHRQH